jgi:hypothetical protein
MSELKHVGRVIATNKKCLVAYRTLPGDANFCLIVPTENLPDIYHDAIINLAESQTGQDAYEFAEALDRTQFPDGGNMLRNLHAAGRLIKVPTNAIEMVPAPGTAIVLSELNQIIAEQRGLTVDSLSIKESLHDKLNEKPAPESKPTSTVELAQTVDVLVDVNDPVAAAKHYRSQADKLAKEAANFRRLAEELVPTKKKAE